MNTALEYHYKIRGKIGVTAKTGEMNKETLSLAYTPGVAEPCKVIRDDPKAAYQLTGKWNSVAIISDGSAVLGLGNIGGLAGLPVMEGKAVLFNKFAGIDAVPIVLSTQNTDEIVSTIKNMAITFGGINLEDIAAPRCFEVEKRLIEELDIPVFHDDQHGTAIVVLAALINALKVVQKKIGEIKIVINGAGAAGTSIAKLLISYGAVNIIMNDRDGILNRNKRTDNQYRNELAALTNAECYDGDLAGAVRGADVFIGVSVKGALTGAMVQTMAKDAVVFAMANPEPEIYPDEALAAGAAVVGTGRSDFDNQINNVLAFPGIFRGALDGGAKRITESMKLAAARAISELVPSSQLSAQYILPYAFDERICPAVAGAIIAECKDQNKK